MRAVDVTAACLFLGVLEGVGSIVLGSMVGGANEFERPSESESVPFAAVVVLRWLENGSFLGVLWMERGVRCRAGEVGDEGGEESCVGTLAKRVFLIVGGWIVGGGVPVDWAFGDRWPLNEEYGLLWAVVRVERRGE